MEAIAINEHKTRTVWEITSVYSRIRGREYVVGENGVTRIKEDIEGDDCAWVFVYLDGGSRIEVMSANCEIMRDRVERPLDHDDDLPF